MVLPAAPSVGTFVKVLRTILPVPFGERVKSSLLPVVISVPTPVKVKVPVVVIAPEETVPILVKFPEASTRCVPPVCSPVAALMVPAVKVASVPLSTRESNVFGVPSASLIVKVPLVPAVAKVRTGLALDSVNGEADEKVLVALKVLA